MSMTQQERADEFKELRSLISEAILKSYDLEEEMRGEAKHLRGIWNRRVTESLNEADAFLGRIEKRKAELGLS